MKTPKRLQTLVDDGLIDAVVGELKSGKEADVYMVRCHGELCCAKVFKEADKRGFKQAVQYQEGRKVRNSRRARAMSKQTRYGQKEQEKVWLNAEVEALYALAAAGVRVPKPLSFTDGVLLMELITDADGAVAPRLDSMSMDSDTAIHYHDRIIAEVVRMLATGLIHGDLSEFNILIDQQGPVIIDLPQAVNASANNSAAMLLIRDVDRIKHFFSRFAPQLRETDYGKELWALYASGQLQPDSKLSGQYKPQHQHVDLDEIMEIIDTAREDAANRLAYSQDNDD